MHRHIIVLIVFLAVTHQSHAMTSAESQNWQCALDLHQGDTGSMSLVQRDDNVDGVIRITAGDTPEESRVTGRWSDQMISLKRLLGENNSEQMAGVVVNLGTQMIKMAGRYSTDYQEVWSAECERVSELAAGQNVDDEPADTASFLLPSTASRVSPNSPSDKDRITFSAVASHPDGIKSVAFYLGDKKIHSCNSRTCDVTYGPVATGKYTWRIEAISQSGVKSSDSVNDLHVRNSEVTERCTIFGSATGPVAEQSPFYLVNLFGPNNQRLFREAASFSQDGEYTFSNLPAGDYRLSVDTRVDEGVLSSPSSIVVNCKSQSRINQDFNFY